MSVCFFDHSRFSFSYTAYEVGFFVLDCIGILLVDCCIAFVIWILVSTTRHHRLNFVANWILRFPFFFTSANRKKAGVLSLHLACARFVMPIESFVLFIVGKVLHESLNWSRVVPTESNIVVPIRVHYKWGMSPTAFEHRMQMAFNERWPIRQFHPQSFLIQPEIVETLCCLRYAIILAHLYI